MTTAYLHDIFNCVLSVLIYTYPADLDYDDVLTSGQCWLSDEIIYFPIKYVII